MGPRVGSVDVSRFGARGCSIQAKGLDLDKFTFPKCDGQCNVPLFAFDFGMPIDGYPPKVQLEKFAESIYHGWEPLREALEIHPRCALGETLHGASVGLTKGFTRASILAFGVIQTMLEEDKADMSAGEWEYFSKLLASKANRSV